MVAIHHFSYAQPTIGKKEIGKFSLSEITKRIEAGTSCVTVKDVNHYAEARVAAPGSAYLRARGGVLSAYLRSHYMHTLILLQE